MERYVNPLKEWTGKARATIIFDSTVDEFTAQGLFAKVKGKRNIAVIGFTTDGDVFGGFYSVAVTKQRREFYDPNIFVFSFESRGRCDTPQRFVREEWLEDEANVEFQKDCPQGFLVFWVDGACGGFFLGNERSDSYCTDLSRGFDGLEDTTLTGKNNRDLRKPPYHHCTRLIAVQLS